MSNQQIAQTIVNQLGGNKFQAMTGAKFSANANQNGVVFSFKGCRKANTCWITLEDNDTYSMQIEKWVGTKITTIKSVQDVYAEQLVTIFENATGLATSL